MAVWLVLWAAGILVALWLLGGALWRGELGGSPVPRHLARLRRRSASTPACAGCRP